jgi:hypothetical protein
VQGHSPRTAHLPPTQYRQLGAQQYTTARRLAPHPILHHHFRGRRNVHRHGGRALDQRAPGASHTHAPSYSASPDATTHAPPTTYTASADATANTASSASTASAVAYGAAACVFRANVCPPSQPALRLQPFCLPLTNSGCSPTLPRCSPARSRWSLSSPSCSCLILGFLSFNPYWLPNLRQI